MTTRKKPSFILLIGLPFIALCIISIPVLFMIPRVSNEGTSEVDSAERIIKTPSDDYIVPEFAGNTFIDYQFDQFTYLINKYDVNGDRLLTGADWISLENSQKTYASLDFIASVYMSFMFAISDSPLSVDDFRIKKYMKSHEDGAVAFLNGYFSNPAQREDAIWRVVQSEFLNLDISTYSGN